MLEDAEKYSIQARPMIKVMPITTTMKARKLTMISSNKRKKHIKQ